MHLSCVSTQDKSSSFKSWYVISIVVSTDTMALQEWDVIIESTYHHPSVDETRELTGEKDFHVPFVQPRIVKETVSLRCPVIRREARRTPTSKSNWMCLILPKEDQQQSYVL